MMNVDSLKHVSKVCVEIAAQAAAEYCRDNGIVLDVDSMAEKVVTECHNAIPDSLEECGRAAVRGELAWPVILENMRKAGIRAATNRLAGVEDRWKALSPDERREFLGRLCSAADSIDSKAANLLGDK